MTIQSQTTNCVYWIDDGTGRVEARHWIDSSSEEDAGKWGGIQCAFSCFLSGIFSIDILGNPCMSALRGLSKLLAANDTST